VRILHVDKFLYRRGGAEAYMLDVAAMQRAAGHEVAFLATAHPENEPSRYASSFPRFVELNPPPPSLKAKVSAVGRMLWSVEARASMERVLDDFRPDVVHLHNVYHHLSPSVLRPLRKRAVPTVMTLHDFKLACPTHRFMANGAVCEACLGRHFHNAILKRCNEGSLGASAVNAVELTMHTYTGAYDPVHIFLCPSRFMLEKMRAARVFTHRLQWVPSFVDAASIDVKRSPGGAIAYVGRLWEEKGVDVLIQAAGIAAADLDVAGDGPELGRLEALAARVGGGRIRFHGHLPPPRVQELIRAAAVTVLPSRAYENLPIAILESFACAVPVVGTAHGGIPELIDPGDDGELVPPNDPRAMAAALRPFLEDPQHAFAMGRSGRRKVEERFSPAGHLALLMDAYAQAAARAGRGGS